MKKTAILALFSVSLTLILPSAAQPRPQSTKSASLRLYGGLNYLYADEFNRRWAGRRVGIHQELHGLHFGELAQDLAQDLEALDS